MNRTDTDTDFRAKTLGLAVN